MPRKYVDLWIRFPRAACLGQTDIFFSENSRRLNQAMTICAGCDHLRECRERAHETKPHRMQVLGGQYWNSRGEPTDKVGYTRYRTSGRAVERDGTIVLPPSGAVRKRGIGR